LFRGKARHVSFISIIACLGVTLGVATLIVVISVMNGFDQDLMEKLLRFNYHITLETVNRDIPDSVIERVRKTQGVESAAVFIQTQVFGKFDDYVFPLVVRGVDFNNQREKQTFEQYLIDKRDNDGFYIGTGLRNKLIGGDKFSYYPLNKKLKVKEDDIKGVFKIGLYDVDNNYLVCGLNKAKDLSDNYLIFLGVRVKDPFAAIEIKKELDVFGKEGFLINTWMENNQALFSALKLEKITMFIILSLIIVVASFNIFGTLTVKVVEKTKDIGILKALGFSPRKILSIFSIQGIILGLIGVAFGAGLGVGLCLLLKEYHFVKLPESIYYIDYLPVSLRNKDIILISTIGLLISFVSSLFPALRASRLKPCEALRYE
ncbi:MAG: ABC transporter permease, partial [Candidatus Omnitrophota bacterium]